MWVAKFKIKHDCWITGKTKQYSFTSRGVPLSAYEEDGKFYHTGVNYLKGKKENKEKFIKSLENDSRVVKFEVKGDQLFTLVEGDKFITHSYQKSLFFVSPVVKEDGYEYWELGSWDRKSLITFFEKNKQFSDISMVKIKKEVPSLVLHQSVPSLTEKQKEAFELAQEFGYYSYPRKISVKDLAGKMNVPRSTFQEHLRKAESKIVSQF